MFLVQRKFRKNMAFYVYLLAVLGSQGIVVKCTAVIFFPTVDCYCDLSRSPPTKKRPIDNQEFSLNQH